MYYQNNFSAHSSNNENSDIPRPGAFNFNNFGNNYFSIPPPPITPIVNLETNFTTSSPPPFYNTSYLTPLNANKASTSPIVQSESLRKTLKDLFPQKDQSKRIKAIPFSNLNVTSIKKDFIKCATMIKEFERLLNLLQVFKKTLSDEDWSKRCEEIKTIEEDISNLLKKYEDEEYYLSVQRVVKRCNKKRLYRKRKTKEWQEMKKIRQASREREHRRIDMWLEKMKDQVEKSRRQEQVKREADLVLSEVTSKKAEAKRFINLFNTLIKLRNARVQQLKSSGEFVSDSEIKTFTQVIDNLKKLWMDHLKECNIEEQGLRVMLNDAEVERVNVEAKVNKQICKKWNEVLFGESTEENIWQPNSLDELIAIRFEWDRFISSSNACLASKIPIGWIVPSEPSSTDWSKFLQK
ncbi:hypothetical protein O3M35_007474 [Rhynocoris fuscipes]|uniref:Programmed cell death protein 7 n=1 Tax=Rhynocoris fuscipes TaxID=488301 RepID=A0AAW1DC62_9HEMI